MMDLLNFSNWRGPGVYLDPGKALAAEQEAALKQRLTYEFVRDRSVYFGPPEDRSCTCTARLASPAWCSRLHGPGCRTQRRGKACAGWEPR